MKIHISVTILFNNKQIKTNKSLTSEEENADKSRAAPVRERALLVSF